MHQHTLFIDIGELRALYCAGVIAIKAEVAAEKVNGLVEEEVEAVIYKSSRYWWILSATA
jgi:hypothetical protein